MNTNKVLSMLAVMALLLAAMVMAGCTSSATNEATPTPAPTTAPTATLAPTPAPTPTLAPTQAPTLAPTATAKPTTSDLPWIDYDFHFTGESNAMKIIGKVNTPLTLKISDLKGYPQHYLNATTGSKTASGTGPYIMDLLNAAGLQDGATSVTFTSADSSYAKTITLAELNGVYSGGIIAIMADNSLKDILPSGSASNLWVKNLFTITVS